MPLDIADPEGGAGEFSGVGVYLQPQHLVGLHPRIHLLPAPQVVEFDNLLFEVEEGTEGGVEEIAAAASRVEHLHGGETVLEVLEPGAGGGAVAGGGQGLGLLAGGGPLAA